MSTKIHDGLRLREGVDVFDLNTRLRELLNPVRDRLDARELVRRAVRSIDGADLKGEPRPTLAILRALSDYQDEQINTDRRLRWHDPHRFSMSLGRDPHTGRVLALPFYEDRDYRDALMASGLFEDYGYWDNEQPEDVSTEEWAARGKAWERVWPGRSAPLEHMLTFDLRPERDYGGMSFIRQGREATPAPVLVEELAAVSGRDRARSHARDLCFTALRAANADADPIRQFMSSSHGTEMVVDAVAPLLADLTVDDLYAEEAVTRSVDLTAATASVHQWLDTRENGED